MTQAINKRSGPFTEDDLGLLNAVAGRIAVSLENAQLYEAMRREKGSPRYPLAAWRAALAQDKRVPPHKWPNILG